MKTNIKEQRNTSSMLRDKIVCAISFYGVLYKYGQYSATNQLFLINQNKITLNF